MITAMLSYIVYSTLNRTGLSYYLLDLSYDSNKAHSYKAHKFKAHKFKAHIFEAHKFKAHLTLVN